MSTVFIVFLILLILVAIPIIRVFFKKSVSVSSPKTYSAKVNREITYPQGSKLDLPPVKTTTYYDKTEHDKWAKFAHRAKTKEECEEIPALLKGPGGIRVIDWCYKGVAVATKDASLCDKIYYHYWISDCKDMIYEVSVAETGEEAKEIIAATASGVFTAVQNKDFIKLSAYVHPEKGVRFSPYQFVDLEDDLVFTAAQIKNADEDKKVYLWGAYDGSGDDMEFDFKGYFRYIMLGTKDQNSNGKYEVFYNS